MTRDEQKAITAFINSTLRCDAPVDVEADAIIRALFVRQPDAAYRITMLAMRLAATEAVQAAEAERPIPEPGKGWLGAIFDKRSRAPLPRRHERRAARTPQSLLTDR